MSNVLASLLLILFLLLSTVCLLMLSKLKCAFIPSPINLKWVEKRLKYHLTSSIHISLNIWIGVKSCMREVNFSISASICAIETSNLSKLQVPRPRNTFDLSTSDLPPVGCSGLSSNYFGGRAFELRVRFQTHSFCKMWAVQSVT